MFIWWKKILQGWNKQQNFVLHVFFVNTSTEDDDDNVFGAVVAVSSCVLDKMYMYSQKFVSGFAIHHHPLIAGICTIFYTYRVPKVHTYSFCILQTGIYVRQANTAKIKTNQYFDFHLVFYFWPRNVIFAEYSCL